MMSLSLFVRKANVSISFDLITGKHFISFLPLEFTLGNSKIFLITIYLFEIMFVLNVFRSQLFFI